MAHVFERKARENEENARGRIAADRQEEGAAQLEQYNAYYSDHSYAICRALVRVQYVRTG